MGGIHAAFRKSPNADSNTAAIRNCFTSVSSDLTVPSEAKAIYTGSASGSGNVIPEFFHVFFNNKYTIDAGVFYKNNGYYELFTNVDGIWAPNGPTAKATGTKTLKSWFAKESGQYYIITQFGSVSFKAKIDSQIYNSCIKGCQIYREMVIAANDDKALPNNCYFKNAKFSNTTLTKNDGTYVPLGRQNSNLWRDVLDNNIKKYNPDYKNYYDSVTSESGSNFVTDTTSATFNKAAYPIK